MLLRIVPVGWEKRGCLRIGVVQGGVWGTEWVEGGSWEFEGERGDRDSEGLC